MAVEFTHAEIAAAVGIGRRAVGQWGLSGTDVDTVAGAIQERYEPAKAAAALAALLVATCARLQAIEDAGDSGRAALIEKVAFGVEMPELPDEDADKIIKAASDLSLARKRAAEALATSGAHVPKDDVIEQHGSVYNVVRAALGEELVIQLQNRKINRTQSRELVDRLAERIIAEINRQLATMGA